MRGVIAVPRGVFANTNPPPVRIAKGVFSGVRGGAAPVSVGDGGAIIILSANPAVSLTGREGEGIEDGLAAEG